MNKCSICLSNNKINSFSLENGGLLCKNCSLENGVSPYDISFLKKIIQIYNSEIISKTITIVFSAEDEIKIKHLYSNFLINFLGIQSNLLIKI